MLAESIYTEVADFMAGMNPKLVLAFKPSDDNQSRLDYLLDKQEAGQLPDDDE